ncbi:hypothetical protein IT774_12500 [Salinimonas marina]|uniref:Uncharacterized protein n=1 Tax=Salinimonas marina TaxID=2785918 RepID=A0A7S9DWD4_9ALTE|nr:hypothetical protein IT774_12500 [Salinimonas marina]
MSLAFFSITDSPDNGAIFPNDFNIADIAIIVLSACCGAFFIINATCSAFRPGLVFVVPSALCLMYRQGIEIPLVFFTLIFKFYIYQ